MTPRTPRRHGGGTKSRFVSQARRARWRASGSRPCPRTGVGFEVWAIHSNAGDRAALRRADARPLPGQLLDRARQSRLEVDQLRPRRGHDDPDHAVIERADVGLPLDRLLPSQSVNADNSSASDAPGPAAADSASSAAARAVCAEVSGLSVTPGSSPPPPTVPAPATTTPENSFQDFSESLSENHGGPGQGCGRGERGVVTSACRDAVGCGASSGNLGDRGGAVAGHRGRAHRRHLRARGAAPPMVEPTSRVTDASPQSGP